MRKETILVGLICLGLTLPLGIWASNDVEDLNARVAKLHVVDCLLPGQVRQLGQRTFLTARRPIKTTAAECEIRGGEYVAFDRADYQTALKVWMQAAQEGDAEAQTNVGEIFEKGLGTSPNYQAAVLWYSKAAEQGNVRAQFNLGTLYETGRGVPMNKLTALNWYRAAWGMASDDVVFSSAAEREQVALRSELEKALEEKEQQVQLLQEQMRQLQQQLDNAQVTEPEQRQTIEAQANTLQALIGQIQAQKEETTQRLDSMPKTREPAKILVRKQSEIAKEISPRMYRDLELGRYFALLIGNQNYDVLEDLDTPHNDVNRAKKLLEDKYGFTVFTMSDSDNIELMEAINDLYSIVGENDNLLIFYAGHGSRLMSGSNEIGYWLPSNAEAPPRNTFWVANEFLSAHLARLKARRVLVVADSCYAGLLSSEPSFLLLGADTQNYKNMDFFKMKLKKRARLLLSSGGDSPVLDGGGGANSAFAKAFFDALEQNEDLISAPQLYVNVKDRVTMAAQAFDFEQEPDFKTIKSAGHEVGDFFFVPQALR